MMKLNFINDEMSDLRDAPYTLQAKFQNFERGNRLHSREDFFSLQTNDFINYLTQLQIDYLHKLIRSLQI